MVFVHPVYMTQLFIKLTLVEIMTILAYLHVFFLTLIINPEGPFLYTTMAVQIISLSKPIRWSQIIT